MGTSGLNERPKWQTYSSYVLMALLTFGVGIVGGVTKFVGNEQWVEIFNIFNYPLWFMYLTGIIEIVATIAMWIPKTRPLGSLAMVVVMIGALISNLIAGEQFMGNVIFMVLGGIVTWMYRDKMMEMMNRA